jgi:hypothetical protein
MYLLPMTWIVAIITVWQCFLVRTQMKLQLWVFFDMVKYVKYGTYLANVPSAPYKPFDKFMSWIKHFNSLEL